MVQMETSPWLLWRRIQEKRQDRRSHAQEKKTEVKTWDLETKYATAKDVEDSLLGVIVAESNARDTTNHALQTM